MPSTFNVGIDEFTIILKPADVIDYMNWNVNAKTIINKFLELAKLDTLYQFEFADKNLQQGYNQGLLASNVPFYLSINWHKDIWTMGVCIRFSAHAWYQYKLDYFDKYKQELEIYKFLKDIEFPDLYIYRISRIDFYADYKNFNDNYKPNYLYENINSKNIEIVQGNGRKYNRKIGAYVSDNRVDTLYIGSRKTNTRCFCRVYDKKKEQLSKKGFRYSESILCDSWTRLEVVFRHQYAHQITDNLEDITNDIELESLIIECILEKFQFIYSNGKDYELTEVLKNNLNHQYHGRLGLLKNQRNLNPDILSSINYINERSGIHRFLYKINEIWSDNEVKEYLEYLYDKYINEYKIKISFDKNVQTWINKNKSLAKTDFKDFLK